MSDDEEERKGRKDRRAPVFFANLAAFAFPIGLAVLFLAFHLPYLPASLEDLDSINFALGIRDFDVAHHQPHPPGYPVFILLAKAVHALGPAEAASLALVSIVAGALGVVAIAALFRRLDGAAAAPPWTAAATAAAMTAPLYWFTAARPLSDTAGLAAAIAVQAFTLSANTTPALAAASFCAGLAGGVRSQVFWLTVPLLALRAWQGLGTRDWGLAGPIPNPKSPIPVAAAFLAGTALWFVPLVIVSGGPAAYWQALFDQGAEDLGNIQMLWNNHGIRDLRDALYYSFVAPWAAWPLAAVVLICAAAGLLRLARSGRTALAALAAAFGPYLAFDLLFQETFTGRYALPLVVPIAYLAISGLRVLPRDSGLLVAVAIAMFCAHIGGTSIAAYSRAAAPGFQLIEAMRAAPPIEGAEPVLAPDRRLSFDLRRPLNWIGDPPFTRILGAPPQHEWLEAVRYWNGGGRGPVWFVVDPKRASIDLVQHGEPQRFRWPLAYPALLSGARPDEMDWYRVDRPDWYVGEGWALTPEAAGVADADRRGPSLVPATAWVTGRAAGGTMMIGGRNLGSREAKIALITTIDASDQPMPDIMAPPGPFLAFLKVPAVPRDADYLRLSVSALRDSRVALEQFDVQPLNGDRPVFGFGAGWHEAEFNPATGARWRWLSDRGELAVRGGRAATLRLEGESPRTYFSRGSRLTIRAGERVVFDATLTDGFSREVPIPAGSQTIVLETDQTYVPAERSRRTQDRRRLGLRLFKVAVF